MSNATTNPRLYQCCSGFCIDLLRLLSEKMSFDYELFEVPDRKWGAYDKVVHSFRTTSTSRENRPFITFN